MEKENLYYGMSRNFALILGAVMVPIVVLAVLMILILDPLRFYLNRTFGYYNYVIFGLLPIWATWGVGLLIGIKFLWKSLTYETNETKQKIATIILYIPTYSALAFYLALALVWML